jgi:hypothetical protein
MSDIKRVKIQNFVESQIPEFLNEDSPLFKEFLEQYYISQEHPTGITDLASNLPRFKDLTTYNNELFFSGYIPSQTVGKVLAFDDVITVSHTIGFPSKYGLIKIGNEIISYTEKTDNSFIGCLRGFSGIRDLNKTLRSQEINFATTKAEEHQKDSQVINLSLIFYNELFYKFKSQFLPGFENRQFVPQVNIRNILSRAVDFYTTKGTDTSYKLLFKVLYNADISIIKPQEYLLRPSDNNYFLTNNILVEQISGSDPFQIRGNTLFQNVDGTEVSASIYSIEYRPVDEKDLYEIYLDSSSFIGNFKTTKKTRVSKDTEIASNNIFVDSTIGFPQSGKIFVKSKELNEIFEISYEDKTNTQFLGVSGVITKLKFGDELYESNFVYSYLEDGSKIEFRLINVIGEIDTSVSTNLSVGDKIRLSSFGAELSDKPEFYSWIYNIPSSHEIISIIRANDSTGKTWSARTFDNIKFYIGEELILTNPDDENDIESPATVSDILSENQIEISSISDLSNKKIIKKVIKTGKSDRDQKPEVNIIPINVQNTYIDDLDEYYYVSSSGLPNYIIDSVEQKISVSTASGVGKTDTLNTNIVHNYYTGEKIYYYANTNSGISSGIYHITCIGDTKDSKKIKLSLSKSDLYSKKYVNVNYGIVSDYFVKLDYEDKIIQDQKILKKFNYVKGENILTEVSSRSTNNKKVGMLINGVEMYSPTLFDENIYYGKLESISITNNGTGYDVINSPQLEITDVSGTGASGFVNVVGSLKEVKIISPGIGYQYKPKIKLLGGNGSGAIIESNLVRSQITSGFKGDGIGVNPTTDTITFFNKHNFDDGEYIIYDANGNLPLVPLKENAIYIAGIVDDNSIKLYESLSDAYNKQNNINLVGISSGFHYFKTVNSKNTITSVYVKNPGQGYSNKIIKIPSILSFDNDTNGVNTFDYYIFAKNHKLKEKDLVRYSTTGTAISGLSTTSEYLVSIVDENKFKLSYAGNGSDVNEENYNKKRYIRFSSIGTGVHSFSYPPIRLSVESLSGIAATSIIEPELEPIVLGSVEDVFIENNGVGYGVSDIINFHRRPDIRIKPISSEALLKPIVLNGSVVDVQFLSFGNGYDKGIDIIVNGSGSFADIRPIIENGKIVSVNIVNGGIGYGTSDTSITVKRRGTDVKFLGNVFEWKINQVEKNKSLLSTSDEGIIVPSKNKDLGLQFVHFNTPKQLRKSIKDHVDESNREVPDEVHSPIIGWAYDGNPIYGPYGQVGLNVRKIRSSYIKKVETNKNLRPDFPGGFFVQDYYFDRAVGDLDEHNGRFCKTPEFPSGVYAYFTTVDSSLISKPEYPYCVGNYFKDYIIVENTTPSFNQNISLSDLSLTRNISPYYINSNNSSYGLISNAEEKYKQEFTVTETLSSNIESVQIYSPGDNYAVGENVIFNSTDTKGTGASAVISKVRGKLLKNVNIGISTFNDTSFYTESNRIVAITQQPHNLNTGETVNIESISDSDFSYFEGTKNIFVKKKSVGITSDISDYFSTGPTTIINVSDTSGFEINDFISIGAETLKITNIDTVNSRFTVNRLENTGVHTVGISTVNLLPTKFYFNEKTNNFIKKNSIRYFNPKTLVGFGSTGTNYNVNDVDFLVPEKSIYLPNHNFYTGQEVIYNVGLGGTGIIVSEVPNPASSFKLEDNQRIYIINKGKNLIGFSTVGFTTISGIGTNYNSLYFYDDISVTGFAHSLTTTYPSIFGRVENYYLDAETTIPHDLKLNDTVQFNINPRNTETVTLRYDLNLRKIITDIVYFNSVSGVDTSNSSINIPNNEFLTGDKVVYYSNGFTEIGGLTNNNSYFVIKNNPDEIRLSEYQSDAILGIGITLSSVGSGSQGIAKINPPLLATKNNIIKFDLSDISLSGMDLKLYKDETLNIELESYKYQRNTIDSGNTGAELIVDTSSSNIPNTLFYNLIPFSPSNPEKFQISSDVDVMGNNKIIINPSNLNSLYNLVSVGTTSFKFNLSRKPESFEYNVNSGISSIYYETTSKSVIGPISQVKLNFGGKGYKKIPRISKIDTKLGSGGVLKPISSKIGRIDTIERIKDGFDYPTDETLRPVLSSPTICQINGISRIGNIGIVTGGKNYNIPPKLKVIGNSNIVLSSAIQGGSVESVSIIQNTNNLTSPLTVLPIRNSNGYDIDDIVYDSITNTVTLELVNSDNQLYPLITTQYGSTEVEFPFKVGDKIFVENCRISDQAIKNNYNSENWGYNFFTITGINTANYTISYSMNNFGSNLGNYVTDSGYGYVVNKSVMAEFEMILADDLGYYSGETVLGYDSFGNNTFSAKVMENGWDDGINQLRLIDSRGELQVGNRLLGTRTRLNGLVESVNQFKLNSTLDITRQKVNDFGDRVGFLNDYQQRISDNNYYQKFSYAIKSELPYDEWKEPIRSLVHPAGFKEFSDLDVVGFASNSMKVGVDTSSFSMQVYIDSAESMSNRYNFSMVFEDEQNSDGSIERVFFPEGINLTSYVLSKTNKVLKIDDFSDQFTGFTTTTGGSIVGLSTFNLRNKNIPLFYREFTSDNSITVDLQNDSFKFTNHNFQSGQKVLYTIKSFTPVAIATASSEVDAAFSYPPVSENFDSPIISFDSVLLTFDSN